LLAVSVINVAGSNQGADQLMVARRQGPHLLPDPRARLGSDRVAQVM